MAKKKWDYLSPSEIIERNPQLEKFWDVRAIGYLLMLQLVRGKKMKRGCLVSESDVLKLFAFAFAPPSA